MEGKGRYEVKTADRERFLEKSIKALAQTYDQLGSLPSLNISNRNPDKRRLLLK